jgi:hypothetical protein
MRKTGAVRLIPSQDIVAPERTRPNYIHHTTTTTTKTTEQHQTTKETASSSSVAGSMFFNKMALGPAPVTPPSIGTEIIRMCSSPLTDDDPPNAFDFKRYCFPNDFSLVGTSSVCSSHHQVPVSKNQIAMLQATQDTKRNSDADEIHRRPVVIISDDDDSPSESNAREHRHQKLQTLSWFHGKHI